MPFWFPAPKAYTEGGPTLKGHTMDKKLSPAAHDLLTRILEDTFPSEFTCKKILEILRSEESVILGASSYGHSPATIRELKRHVEALMKESQHD